MIGFSNARRLDRAAEPNIPNPADWEWPLWILSMGAFYLALNTR